MKHENQLWVMVCFTGAELACPLQHVHGYDGPFLTIAVAVRGTVYINKHDIQRLHHRQFLFDSVISWVQMKRILD